MSNLPIQLPQSEPSQPSEEYINFNENIILEPFVFFKVDLKAYYKFAAKNEGESELTAEGWFQRGSERYKQNPNSYSQNNGIYIITDNEGNVYITMLPSNEILSAEDKANINGYKLQDVLWRNGYSENSLYVPFSMIHWRAFQEFINRKYLQK